MGSRRINPAGSPSPEPAATAADKAPSKPGPKTCVEIPGDTYALVNMVASALISGGICVGAAIGMYTDTNVERDEPGVWAWPNTIAGDLVVTSIVMGVITWVVTGGLTLNDDFRAAPVKIVSYPSGPAPRWVTMWPLIQPLFFNDPSRDYLNPLGKCAGLLQNLKVGLMLGLLMAAAVAIPLSLLLLAKTDRWTVDDLVILKGLYGAAVEVPIAYVTVRTALQQCRDHAEHGRATEEQPREEQSPENSASAVESLV
eukprot:m.107855 g.107855  ORF g.107855 m.107855 type:complete len:256 (-) comp12777_c0_seq3:199-966(-)